MREDKEIGEPSSLRSQAGGLNVFVSYAHEDRAFKDTLLKHLKGLTRRGLVAPWADHAIDGGEDWHAAIVRAMDACEMGLLLVSPDFINSDFIHSKELSRLLLRRENEGIRVVPIIVRPCHWQSETIGKLQALPEDGKAILTLDRQPGGSDEAWADIAAKVEVWANEYRGQKSGPSPNQDAEEITDRSAEEPVQKKARKSLCRKRLERAETPKPASRRNQRALRTFT